MCSNNFTSGIYFGAHAAGYFVILERPVNCWRARHKRHMRVIIFFKLAGLQPHVPANDVVGAAPSPDLRGHLTLNMRTSLLLLALLLLEPRWRRS